MFDRLVHCRAAAPVLAFPTRAPTEARVFYVYWEPFDCILANGSTQCKALGAGRFHHGLRNHARGWSLPPSENSPAA